MIAEKEKPGTVAGASRQDIRYLHRKPFIVPDARGTMEDLPRDLPEHIAADIHAGWLRIHSKKLEGADTDRCLREAYDVCATAMFNRGYELDDAVFCELIPSLIVDFAPAKEWLPPDLPDQQYEDLKERLSGQIDIWRIVPAFTDRLRAGFLKIHAKKLEGADSDRCLREAYDFCVTAMRDFNQELSEGVLCQGIPAMVFAWATLEEWLPPGPPDQQYEDLKERLSGQVGFWRAHRVFTDGLRAGFLKIHAKKLEGADTDLCLREAYDVCATAMSDFDPELDDVLLCEWIPDLVFHWATLMEWFPPGPPDQQHEDLKKRLGGRIAYWQAEAPMLARKKKRRPPLELVAFMQVKRLMKEPHEKIPERLVRTDLAEEYGIKPEEVTWDQIRLKLSRLDDPAVEVIPLDPATDDSQRRFGYLLSDVMRELSFGHRRLWLTKRELVAIERVAAAPTPPATQPESHNAEHAQEEARLGDPALLAEPPDDDLAKRAKARSEWLDQKLVDNRWTADTEIQANRGPAYNTIQRYRSGQRSSRDPYVRLRLSSAFHCTLSEVPE
jgi:hypothetical protein